MQCVSEYLGADFRCSACGARHRTDLREVLFGDDAVRKLPALLERQGAGPRASLLADVRTQAAAGAAVADALRGAGLRVQVLVVPDGPGGSTPACDDATRNWAEARLPATDTFVAVGSGVMNDLTKWIAGDRRCPYVAVATAASMNGYASANIAPTIEGVKRLVYGTGPQALVSSPALLREAPFALTAAGLGDVIAKPVSAADWRLNQLLFGDAHCPLCAGLIDGIEPLYLTQPELIRERAPAGLAALLEALLLTGLAMSMAGTSAPASGGEHLISHALDMMSMVDGTPHDLHGRQVGIATILCAALYERVLACSRPRFKHRPTVTEPRFWGRLAEAVEAEHTGKRSRAAAAVTALQERPELWDSIRTELGPGLRAPAAVRQCLARAGAAHCLAHIGVSRSRFLAALEHAHEIRGRYTVLDLAAAAGVLPEAGPELVDRWLMR